MKLCLATGRRRRRAGAAALCACLALLGPTRASAAEIVVTDEADTDDPFDGRCSLREAIESANADAARDSTCADGAGADVIVLGPGEYAVDQAGADEDANVTGDLDITTEVTLRGDGIGATALVGDGSDRLFDVISGGTLRIEDVTLRGGAAEEGGCLRVAGAATLVDARLTDCRALGPQLTSASNSPGGPGLGGAIHVSGTLEVERTTLDANVARGGTGLTLGMGGGAGGGMGGAIFLAAGSTVRILRSTLHANLAEGGFTEDGGTRVGGGGAGLGGAIFNGGGALQLWVSTVHGNAVRGGTAGTNLGGGASGTGANGGFGEGGEGARYAGDGGFGGGGGAGFPEEFTGRLGRGGFGGGDTGEPGEGYGAGVFHHAGTSVLSHVTITANAVDGAGSGGGIYVYAAEAGDVAIGSSLLLDNGDTACGTEAGAVLGSDGNNVVATGTGCPTVASDAAVTDGPLGALEAAGGPTPTVVPAHDSAAVDAGSCTLPDGSTLMVDQRGLPIRGGCDAGAAEVQCPVALEGMTCDDGDPCNVGETCTAGVCGGGGPVDCSGSATECRAAGRCDPEGVEGNCDLPGDAIRELEACDDTDPCTVEDRCERGSCVGVPPDCSSTATYCRGANTCDPAGEPGNCDLPGEPRREGRACGDAMCVDATTRQPAPRCGGGECVARDPEPCPGGGACEGAGTCGPGEPARPDGGIGGVDGGTDGSMSGGCAAAAPTEGEGPGGLGLGGLALLTLLSLVRRRRRSQES